MEFGIRWEGSTKNNTVTRTCPNGKGVAIYYITGHCDRGLNYFNVL